jgi:cytochrome c oxidase subunit 2
LINAFYLRVLNLPPQASQMAKQIDALHFVEITFYTVVAVAFMGSTVWFLVRYRRREPPGIVPTFHAPELVVVYALCLLATFLAFWFVSFRQYVTVEAAPDGAMPIYVTAKQWIWTFEYPQGVNSAGILYVPAHQPVRMILTSRDVIHSFYVPALRIKQDVVPGTYTSIWFEADTPGSYPLRCAELCGVGHSTMSAQVVVMAPQTFSSWMNEQRAPVQSGSGVRSAGPEDLVAAGRKYAADYGCLNCHTADGRRHIGPSWASLYGSVEHLTDGSDVVADPAYLTQSMMEPRVRIVAGFDPVMPSFQGVLQPAETAAIIEFIRSLRQVPRSDERVVR